MNKLSYKLTYQQAKVLADIALQLCNNCTPTAANLLAAATLLQYSIVLHRRLIMHYKGHRVINMPYTTALAYSVLTTTLVNFNPLQLAVLLPVLDDVDQKILNQV